MVELHEAEVARSVDPSLDRGFACGKIYAKMDFRVSKMESACE